MIKAFEAICGVFIVAAVIFFIIISAENLGLNTNKEVTGTIVSNEYVPEYKSYHYIGKMLVHRNHPAHNEVTFQVKQNDYKISVPVNEASNYKIGNRITQNFKVGDITSIVYAKYQDQE